MAPIDDNMVEDGKGEIEEQLSVVEEKILSWEADECTIWDSGLDEADEYLNAVDEAQRLTEILENQCLYREEDKGLLSRARDVLQTAMLTLEKEFKHILVQYRRPSELEHMSFRTSEDVSVDESIASFRYDSTEEPTLSDTINRTSEDYVIDLVHPHVIPYLKCIANLMFMSSNDHECCQAYVTVRKDALDECLFNLEMENLSIEDVLKMDWDNVNSKIKRCVRAIKVFVRPYLASEKWLCNQIFADVGSASLMCFTEVARASMMQLLNDVVAISIGWRQPEKLVRILEVYEVLVDLLPDIDVLFMDEAGSSIRREYNEALNRLGDSIRPTFLELQNAVESNASIKPLGDGGIHSLTIYVMNYIQPLAEFKDTLNLLLKNQDGAAASPLSADMSPATEEGRMSEDFSGSCSMALNFHSLTSVLQVNLYDQSKLYRDTSLQHLFLMNNINYMVQKVKNSELRLIFGDKWIRKHNWKIQQHALSYERATWSSILSLLMDCYYSSGSTLRALYSSVSILTLYSSGSILRALLKERFRNFYVAFEEVYKTQTEWVVPDAQLREDLRISISQKLISAYRSFVGRFMWLIREKHIKYKYNAEDLQDYLLDFFEGSKKSLHNRQRW